VSREITRVLRGLFLVVLVVAFIGCAETRKLRQENEQLKAQVLKLSDTLAETKAENERLQAEKVGAEGELSKARAEAAQKTSELEKMTQQLKGQGFEVAMREGMMVVTMPQKLLYPSGSASIGKAGRDKLQTLAKALSGELKGFPVEVQGHTDNEPIRRTKDKYKSNWELSYDRAQTVAYSLIKSGVEPNRIRVSAYGEYHPVASNSTADGRSKNRRVEIVVMRPTAK